MSCDDVHVGFGAYVLGGLTDRERAAVDAHLIECPAGAAELSELEELSGLLGRLTVADLATAGLTPSPDLLDRTVTQLDRYRHRNRRRVAATAVGMAGLAAAGLVGAAIARPHDARTPSFSASAAGVTMRVGVRDQPGGTALAVSVAGLPENEQCRLIAVSRDGGSEPVGSWKADYEGAAEVSEASSFPASRLSSIRLVGGDGATLVSVPVR